MATEEHPDFALHWTVGFAGKRQIAPARESIVRDALSRALDALLMKAVDQGASLTAVSSIARGGDLIFAEAALGKDHRRKWPWKCVLPFPLEPFLDHDHAKVGRHLLEPDRCGEPGRAGADDDDVELHRFPGGQIVGHGFLAVPCCSKIGRQGWSWIT